MRFFRLIARVQKSMLFGGPSSGTEYSLKEACPSCGSGAAQMGPLKLKSFKAPRAALFATLDGEIIVSRALGEKLRSRHLRCLGPVVDAKSGDHIPFYQLVCEGVLPAFPPDAMGFVRESPCPVCGRDGYYDNDAGPLRVRYEGVDNGLRSMDFLCTHERFGKSVLRKPFSESVLARPAYLASSRLVDALKEEAVRGLELQPVEIS